MLMKLGAPGQRTCFDPDLVRRARVMKASGRAAAAESPAPEAAPLPPPPPPPAPALAAAAAAGATTQKAPPLTPRQSELASKLAAGTPFVLPDVEFAGRTAVLARTEGLADLARALGPSLGLHVEVYVDATRDPSQDARASMAQAMEIVRQLVALGVARDRIAQEARGGDKPILPNFTAHGRAANRRVEVTGVKPR
jgi:outer membrane protein OmpA-like peptidoglycan-associated protein